MLHAAFCIPQGGSSKCPRALTLVVVKVIVKGPDFSSRKSNCKGPRALTFEALMVHAHVLKSTQM